LHVAEVMVRKTDMFGDGVNIVARIQSIADPGCIALSAAVHEYVRRVLPLNFEDLGHHPSAHPPPARSLRGFLLETHRTALRPLKRYKPTVSPQLPEVLLL
jgi:class 3 adenylate cyclase